MIVDRLEDLTMQLPISGMFERLSLNDSSSPRVEPAPHDGKILSRAT